MALPHSFDNMGNNFKNPLTLSGIYYRLRPLKQPIDHISLDKIHLPVSGENNFSMILEHTWANGDNISKRLLGSLANPDGGNVVTYAGAVVARAATHATQGGLYGSGCALYLDTPPPTFIVQSKIFTTGNGETLALVDKLREDTTGRPKGGWFTNNVARVGAITPPGWWEVGVVALNNGSVTEILTYHDMICSSLNIAFLAPWHGTKPEPSVVEFQLTFNHAFRGLASSISMK